MRHIAKTVTGMPATDGAGVKLKRIIGTPALDLIDPFLMLDEFGSDDPDSWIAGFPDHPHRGFETVTIMLDGRVKHADSVGNSGVIEAGDVQWMTAGRGIIHSEMPERADGRLRGFQLWVNLPGALKMSPPRYQDVPAARIATVARDGASVRVIAGEAFGAKGAANTLVPVRLLDVTIAAASDFTLEVPDSHACFVYAYEGTVREPDRDGKPREIARGTLAVLEGSGGVTLTAGSAGAKLLFADGQPIREPIARYGPFVMNTREEVAKAFDDYSRGALDRAV
ncbi:MAG TPA: pirin family protein [Burkholderiales bacterium]|nr:pirin family protein [Burkholderiales bacterium]